MKTFVGMPHYSCKYDEKFDNILIIFDTLSEMSMFTQEEKSKAVPVMQKADALALASHKWKTC